VSIGLSDEHLALAESVRRFLEARCRPAVLRAAVDAEAEALPPFWSDAADLGWLGLHLPDDVGGQGYGLAELAVVLEELGRALAPGPLLPAVWAAAAIRDGGGAHRKLLAGLAAGETVATVALTAPLAGRAGPGGTVAVSGSVGPVLSGTLADVTVVPVAVDVDRGDRDDRDDRWFVVPASAFEATPLDSLDPTRRLATLTLDGAVLDRDQALPSLDRARVQALGATLVAAECAGIADWCTRTAAAYAAVREQFGRPIGQFQGVKHRCADMLVATEQARSVAWDAARALDDTALDDATPAEEARLAAAVAGAVAPDAAVRVAKDCIQVLGGIGFTWEHDAHLYLRRATSLRQLLGGRSPWRAEVARAALAGHRRRPKIALPAGADSTRDEVRRFAESVAGLPEDERRRRLVDGGWFVPHWPPPWGRDATAAEQLVIDEELRRARIRRPHLQVGAWAAPTIAVHGTPEQQERWVRPTLLGTISWCQMFSEPGAGSDLASLTTTATRTDGGWLVTGQKVWTSMAREADWGICLVRTNRDAPKHLGITYVVVDMRTPGLDVRPLREMTGLEMFNEVFLTDVFVPDDCVIGEVDGGWPLARTTLANERVSMGSGSSFGGGVEALLALVAERRAGPTGADDRLLLDQLGATVAEAQTVSLLGARSTQRSLAGAAPGAESSVRKLLGVEHDQRTQELGLALLGPEGATTAGAAAQWTFGFLANRCLTIAGGTSEIQRNVIAERLLGLPRDP
jgi:alkylation response protein AidB-like acyl-CoA dehydrogenase